MAVYGRDGRHVERVVLDVDDPYLGHDTGSLAAEDEDMDHIDRLELGAANHHRYSQYAQHHKLRRSDVGLAGLPLPTPTTPVETLHHKPPPPVSALFGSLFRTVQTIFLLGAVGATVTLLRVHFLLATAGGRAAAATSGGGGAVAIFGSVASSLASSSQGLVAGGGIAAVRLANGALALPPVTDLLLTAAVRQAARSERAVLREQVQRTARMLPDGRPVSPPGSGGRRLSTQDGGAPASAGGGETYAVRLSTTPGRSDLTDAAVERLARCPSIADVRLDRSSEGKASGDGGSDLLGGWGDEGSIIKRPALTTDAVLLLADDLAFTCEELDRGKSYCVHSLFSRPFDCRCQYPILPTTELIRLPLLSTFDQITHSLRCLVQGPRSHGRILHLRLRSERKQCVLWSWRDLPRQGTVQRRFRPSGLRPQILPHVYICQGCHRCCVGVVDEESQRVCRSVRLLLVVPRRVGCIIQGAHLRCRGATRAPFGFAVVLKWQLRVLFFGRVSPWCCIGSWNAYPPIRGTRLCGYELVS